MAVSDYTGRTVDLFIMDGAKSSGMQPISPSLLFDEGGKVTTAVQKAAQFFLVVFLTEKGSRKHQPTFGSNFLTQIRRANMTDSFMKVAFSDAAEDVLEQQNRYRESDAKSDEIVVNADLLAFSTSNLSELSLTIELTTLAGDSKVFVTPISLAVK